MAEFSFQPSVRDERGLGLEAVLARLAGIDSAIVQTNHLATVNGGALPAIAWGWDMLGPLWEVMSTEAAKRAYLLDMYELQGRRGVPWSVITALGHLGWTATVLENQVRLTYNGAGTHNGYWYYGTGFGMWYEWGIQLDCAAKGFATNDHALLSTVAQYYGPYRSRMVRIVLQLEDPNTSGGGAPDWVGATALDRIGVWNGTAWITRPFRQVVTAGTTATLTWRLFGVDGTPGETWSKLGLIKADGTVYAEVTRAAGIVHQADMELFGVWTINW